VNALDEWLDIRAEDEKYDDTDALWLTRVGTQDIELPGATRVGDGGENQTKLGS